MSGLLSKADIHRRIEHVCLVPIADIRIAALNIMRYFRTLSSKKPIASSFRFSAGYLHSRRGCALSFVWRAIDKLSIQIGPKHLRIANLIGID